MKANKVKGLVVLAFTVLIILAISWHVIANPDLLAVLGEISAVEACWLVVLRVVHMGVNGLFLRAFASKFGIGLRIKEWFGLSVITSLGNYITPVSGGMLAKAAYLKARHSFPYAQFATLLASNYVVVFWVVGVMGFGVTVLRSGGLQGAWVAASLFGVVAVAVTVLVTLPSARLPWENPLVGSINLVLKGWAIVKRDKLLMTKLVAYTTVNLVLNGVSFQIAFGALEHAIPFTDALLISLTAAFGILINITPGNLGVQEIAVSLSAQLLGSGANLGLLVALLIRGATLVVVFSLGPLFGLILSGELANRRSQDCSTD